MDDRNYVFSLARLIHLYVGGIFHRHRFKIFGSHADWDEDDSIAEIDSIIDQVIETNRLRMGFT